MAFKEPTVKKTITDISQALIYVRSTKKFGKTTLFRDIILEKYNDPGCGLLLGMGHEYGYSLLDDLNSTQIESWKDMEDFLEWLASDNEKAKKIKMVSFDTIDELIPLAEEEICRQWEKKKKVKCESINEAFGGYNAGHEKTIKLIKKVIARLRKLNIGVFAIAHTKLRTVKDKGSEGTEGYQVLTSNLDPRYESLFGDIFDFVFTGNVDREINDGVVLSDERRLYFRGNTRIDAGGRYSGGSVPEYMVFENENNAAEFIKIVEEGMRNSLRNKKTDEEYEQYKKEVEEERIEESKKSLEEEKEAAANAEANKYLDFAVEKGIDFARKYYSNDKFKSKVAECLENASVKKIQELPNEDFAELIKYAVEELGLSMEI